MAQVQRGHHNDLETLKIVSKHLNNRYPTIRFTYEWIYKLLGQYITYKGYRYNFKEDSKDYPCPSEYLFQSQRMVRSKRDLACPINILLHCPTSPEPLSRKSN